MSIIDTSGPGANREVISVSDLNRSARRLLEGEFPVVYVEGEISNFASPSSGHWYFTLKDDQSQLRCAMFRFSNRRIRFVPRNGIQIIARGKVSLYEGRGEFQLITEHMEEAGDGALRRAYEKLKANLRAEGLFDESIKKPLPQMPQHVAIITSPTGAAIHDVLAVMQRRFPAIRISIVPVQVQGDVSASQIADALHFANQYQDNPFDIILLTRGGGSLEDLWSFNTEVVARAVYASKIPVVCAVGHESDVSIADFVADLRAPTPSAAAELITPDVNEWIAKLNRLGRANNEQMISALAGLRGNLSHIAKRLRHPGQRLQNLHQRLDDLEIRLKNNFRYQLGKLNLDDMGARMAAAMERSMERFHAKFQVLLQKLNTLSPLSTLERGYAIVSTASGQIIKHADELSKGDLVNARLAKGRITAEVKSVSSEKEG